MEEALPTGEKSEILESEIFKFLQSERDTYVASTLAQFADLNEMPSEEEGEEEDTESEEQGEQSEGGSRRRRRRRRQDVKRKGAKTGKSQPTLDAWLGNGGKKRKM